MIYVVPYDFTHATENAMKLALEMADSATEVMLLHIVKKQGDQRDAEEKLEGVVSEHSGEGKLTGKVIVGNIFEDIAKISEVVDAHLIFMGTHGIHGMQKLMGSHAIKVISSSAIPFVVVSDHMVVSEIKKIVMPFDLSKESVQILSFATELAEKYNAEIHLLGGEQTDEFLIHKSKSNVKFSSDFLAKKGVKHEIVLLPRKKHFQDEVVRYSKEIGANLIAVGYARESVLPQFDTFTQSLITNEVGLPVLVINAEEILSVNSQYSFITI